MAPLRGCQETGLSISFFKRNRSLLNLHYPWLNGQWIGYTWLNGQWIGYKATLLRNVKYFRIFLPIPSSLKTWFKHLLPFYIRYLFCFSSVHVPGESLFLLKACPFCAKNRWNFRLLVFWLEIQGTTLFRLTPPGGSDWLDWLPETPDLSPDLKNSRRFAGCFRWRTAALHRCKARVTKLHKKFELFGVLVIQKCFFSED